MQHLAAVTSCGDSRGAVDIDAQVVVATKLGLAGVETHPDADRELVRPVRGGQLALGVDRCADRVHR